MMEQLHLHLVKAYYEGLATAVADVDQSESISIYPNPANDVLQITSSTEMKSIRIYNIVGKLVAQHNLNGQLKMSINISDLTSGIYLVNIETVSGVSNISKIVKK